VANLGKTILKDGLIALVFWVVVRVWLIWEWQYTGHVISLGLGVILVVSFIGVTLRRFVDYFNQPKVPPAGGVGGGGEGGFFPPLVPKPAESGSSGSRTCPNCRGARMMPCQRCGGHGQTLEGGEWKTCGVCMGIKERVCSVCLGSGVV
jgi:hypothetical protein